MLSHLSNKTHFLIGFFLLCLLQLSVALSSPLFVDEAFYWLEGQYLAWSYSEVPGFIPWLLAGAQWLFPNDPFWIRLPSLTMAVLIPWMGMYLAFLAGIKQEQTWVTGLLLISLPLLGIAGTLAIADIWIIGFTLLSLVFWTQASTKKRRSYFVGLGFILAIGINIHIRFWLIVLIACLVIFWQYKGQKEVIYSLLKVTFPIMLIGFVPIFIFNIQNDFPLLSFQLKERHPWEFQANHLSFFLVQIVITTPLLFLLCLKSIKKHISSSPSKKEKLIYLLTSFAVIHWLTYALLGFFSDTLRLNIHWTLVSYILMLIAASLQQHNTTLKTWAIITGLLVNMSLLLTLLYWQSFEDPKSNLNARVTQNAMGWEELSAHTEQLLMKNKDYSFLADNFMTLSQLKFYSSSNIQIKSIPHPLNIKHGREKQLEIMNLSQQKTDSPHLLLVEHTALKLEQQIPFYQNTCNHLNGIELIDSLDLFNGLKTYHYFRTGNGKCQLPPIIYHEKNTDQVSGWLMKEIDSPVAIEIERGSLDSQDKISTKLSGISSNELFKSLDPKKHQLMHFSFSHKAENNSIPLQLSLNTDGVRVLSQRLN